MRVACHTIDEFLQNLEGQSILLNTIWISNVEVPLNGKNKLDATSFRIGIQVSAVVEMEDGGQYLLEAGEETGVDRRDAQPELDGTEGARALRKKIDDYCQQRSWQTKPGMLDI